MHQNSVCVVSAYQTIVTELSMKCGSYASCFMQGSRDLIIIVVVRNEIVIFAFSIYYVVIYF
jgi:hypothetical protein